MRGEIYESVLRNVTFEVLQTLVPNEIYGGPL